MSEPGWDDEPELLPEQTRDDSPTGWGERPESDDELLARYLADRPPHHGGN